MTLAELSALCYQKIDEKNPLRLPDIPQVAHSPKEYQTIVDDVVDEYAAKSHYSSILMDAISEVYQTLHAELALSLSREEVQQLPPDTQLPPHTNELAEKLRNFPTELREGKVDMALTFEGLRNSQASDALIAEVLLADPRIDFDHRKQPRTNSFLGTLSLNDRKKIDVDFLYWFDGVHFWMYDWVHHEWEDRGHQCPFFNFQVNL